MLLFQRGQNAFASSLLEVSWSKVKTASTQLPRGCGLRMFAAVLVSVSFFSFGLIARSIISLILLSEGIECMIVAKWVGKCEWSGVELSGTIGGWTSSESIGVSLINLGH